MDRPARTFVFQLAVPASGGTGQTATALLATANLITVPYDGFLTDYEMSFPAAAGLSGRIYVNGEQVAPAEDAFHSASDARRTIDGTVKRRVHEGDQIQVWGQNTANAAATIDGYVTIEGIDGELGRDRVAFRHPETR